MRKLTLEDVANQFDAWRDQKSGKQPRLIIIVTFPNSRLSSHRIEQ